MSVRPAGVVLAAALALGAARQSDAGPYHSFSDRALGADVIVELEQPSRADKKKAAPQAPPLRVARVLLGEPAQIDERALSMPPVPDFCFKRRDPRKPVRVLEFFKDGHAFGSLDHREGGYTSANPDYDLIVEAVVNVAYWRRQAATQKDWTHEVDAVGSTKNRYLRYLGALFLTKQSPGAAARLEPLTHAPSEHVWAPSCRFPDGPHREAPPK
jgi:hypothetical protein